MIPNLFSRIKNSFISMTKVDQFDFNKFILKNIIYHIFKTKNILPLIVGICIIGFSVMTQISNYIFIPQSNVGSYASFFIFTIIVSIIILICYPLCIILLVNMLIGHIKSKTHISYTFKILILLVSFIAGAMSFSKPTTAKLEVVQIVIIWCGIYIALASMYIAHINHSNLLKLSRAKWAFIAFTVILSAKPLLQIDLHTSEAFNFTNINPQVYLSSPNCMLLHNLNEALETPESNNILYDTRYYHQLSNNQGCYIYGNIIRYSFGSDFVLLVKKNITPITGKDGLQYNAYVRLNCFSNNCYSENNLYAKNSNDYYAILMKTTKKDELHF